MFLPTNFSNQEQGGNTKMAKRKVNVSAAVRDHFIANPSDKPKAIAAALKAKGINVKPEYVSLVLLKFRKGGGKPTKGVGRPTRVGIYGKASGSLGLEELRLAKELVRATGSIQRAKETLDAFAEITS